VRPLGALLLSRFAVAPLAVKNYVRCARRHFRHLAPYRAGPAAFGRRPVLTGLRSHPMYPLFWFPDSSGGFESGRGCRDLIQTISFKF
jgi:hypothetical protein